LGAVPLIADLSTPELLLYGIVGLGAALFVGYLLIDGAYHKLKWRRIQRKFKESEKHI
jgi:hypothetical protein